MINLVIQRTFNGLKTDYKSEELQLSNNDLENIFGDEQNAAQLANSSLIFTVENHEKYRVYSYINTSVSDNAGRAGYYAIRLLIPTDKILVNLNAIFNKLSHHYEHYFENKDLLNQNYDDLLAAIIKQNCLLDKSVLTSSKRDGVFYLKYAANERVDDTMNEDSTYLIKKIYLFAKEQSKSDEIIQQSNFKSFAAFSSEIKQVKVTNPDRYLKELKINGKNLKLPQEENYNIYLLASDILTYTDLEGKKEKSFAGASLNVYRPQPIYKPQPLQQSNHNREGFSLGSLLAASIATLIIGSAVSWFFTYDHYTEKIALIRSEQPEQVMAQSYYFSLDPSIKDFTLLGNNISEISSYKFKYSDKDKKWTYTDGNAPFNNLDSLALNEIGRKGSLNEEDLKNALEKISGKTIELSKEINPSESAITVENSSKSDVITETTSEEKKNGETKSQTTPPTNSTKTSKKVIQNASNKETKNNENAKSKASSAKQTQPPTKTPSSSNDDPINSVNKTIKK